VRLQLPVIHSADVHGSCYAAFFAGKYAAFNAHCRASAASDSRHETQLLRL